MNIKKETMLKAIILTRGVEFTERALKEAVSVNAKRQNRVYNLPQNSDYLRPQELMLTGADGYQTVVSCVASVNESGAVVIDEKNGALTAQVDGRIFEGISIEYVAEPGYYSKTLKNGKSVKDYVSACGLDELNILPWRGCAIDRGCRFCGINKVSKSEVDCLTARDLSRDSLLWNRVRDEYLENLKEAVNIAKTDDCYEDHKHVILISGNLSNDKLDEQSRMYSDIALELGKVDGLDSSEGLVAVMMPPENLGLLNEMKKSGIDKVVFNLEVATEPWFSKYCPGKKQVGAEYISDRLVAAVDVFGENNVWTNFVLGLEPVKDLLVECEKLAEKGIVPGANVLHLDEGHSLDCSVPDMEDVLLYFFELSGIYRKYNMKPYYCQKALRTSLSNEAFDGRMGF